MNPNYENIYMTYVHVVGGGGKDGIKARTESKLGMNCSICRAAFTSVKMKAQFIEHQQTKHPKNTFAECFPSYVDV